MKLKRDYAAALYNAFAGKCAFCESKMAHVSPAHIEHYRPKGDRRFVHLMFRWDNWLLSCHSCNSRKGDDFPDCSGEPCLIDPTQEPDPGAHLDFVGPHVTHRTVRGRETIKLVELDRSKLEDQRGLWLSCVDQLLLLLLIPEAHSDARTFLIWAKQDDAPYTAMTLCYLCARFPAFAHTEYPRVHLNEPIEGIRALVDQFQDRIADLLQ